MNVGELKALVMFQTNNDADDVGDYLPHLNAYIAQGYDLLVHAWAGTHPGEDEAYPLLTDDE